MSVLQRDVRMGQTPYSLLTRDELLVLQEHYRIAKACKCKEAFEKAFNGWTERQRQVARGLYDRLFGNGFVITGQHESGALEFGRRKPNAVDVIMGLSDQDFREYREGRLVYCDETGTMVRREHGAQG